MIRSGIFLFFVSVSSPVWGGSWASPLDHLRVWDIGSSTFDYVFTGSTPSTSKKPVLSFNERGGRTHFVHEREMLGDFQVWSYMPRTTNVFKRSINRMKTVSIGEVVLRHPKTYQRVTLTENRLSPEDGYTARLTRLDSGQTWVVKEGDFLFYDDWRAEVVNIDATVLVVRLDSGSLQWIPHVSDRGRVHVTGVWKEIARARAEAEARLAEERAVEREERARRLAAAQARLEEARAATRPEPLRTEVRYRSLIPPEVLYPPVVICPDCGLKVNPRGGRCRCRSYGHSGGSYPYRGGTITYGGFSGGSGIATVEAPEIRINILPARSF